MGRGGWDKKEGDQAPKFTLGYEGRFQFQNRGEAGGGQIEKPGSRIHGDQTAGEVGNGPTAEVMLESVGPASGAHAPGKPVRA